MSDAGERVVGRSRQRRIVVGVDGSAASLRAVEWAAREAVVRDATVEIVHVPYFPEAILSEYSPEAERIAFRVLRLAVAHARHTQPDARVTGRLVDPPIVRSLVDVAHDADLLVVAPEGNVLRRLAMHGSVSTAVVRRAQCPVVVVRTSQDGSSAAVGAAAVGATA